MIQFDFCVFFKWFEKFDHLERIVWWTVKVDSVLCLMMSKLATDGHCLNDEQMSDKVGVNYQPVICLGMFLCLTFRLRGEGNSGNSTCSNMLPFCVVVGVLLSIEFQQDMYHGFSISLTSKEFWNKTLQKNGHLFLVGSVQETDWLGRLLSPIYLVVSNIFYVHPYLGKWSNLTNIFQMGWNHQMAHHLQGRVRFEYWPRSTWNLWIPPGSRCLLSTLMESFFSSIYPHPGFQWHF